MSERALRVITLLSILWLSLGSTGTTTPTMAPTLNTTTAPAAPNTNASQAPTVTPLNHTLAPTPASSHHHANSTLAPTPSPTTVSNSSSTPAPSAAAISTSAPTHKHSHNDTNATLAPTMAPSNHGTMAPTNTDEPSQHLSFWRIIGKTIAWLILMGLSVVAFGAIMSHRYRIYFALRGLWYTLLRLDCTLWILRKLRMDTSHVDTSLNTIIFDNEMSEGLLMRENNE